jgi:flagellar basal body rod protein FlgG
MKNKLIFYFFIFNFIFVSSLFAEDLTVRAMNNYEKQYEVLMNNVVNANTAGYKANRVVTFAEDGELQTEIVPDKTRGTMMYSGDDFNLAIDGPGYFVVESPQGLMYTRDGRLKLNSQLQLVTLVGNYPIYGESGPINLNADSSGGVKFSVSEGGQISQKEGIVDRLLIGEITDYSQVDIVRGAFFKQRLVKKSKGGNVESFAVDADVFQTLENAKIRQGYYEASNVDMAKELITMPMIAKKYDANSKVLQIKKRTRKSALEMGKAQ